MLKKVLLKQKWLDINIFISTLYPSAAFSSVLPVSSNICLSSALRRGASQRKWPSRPTPPSHLLFSCCPTKGSSRRAVPSGEAPGLNAQQGPLWWCSSAPQHAHPHHHIHAHIRMQHAVSSRDAHAARPPANTTFAFIHTTHTFLEFLMTPTSFSERPRKETDTFQVKTGSCDRGEAEASSG